MSLGPGAAKIQRSSRLLDRSSLEETGAALDGRKGAKDRCKNLIVAGICFHAKSIFLAPRSSSFDSMR